MNKYKKMVGKSMELYTQTAVGKLLGVTKQTIQDWINGSRDFDQCLSGTKVDLELLCKWLYDWKNECEEDSGSGSDLKKLYAGKNEKLKYEIKRETLIPKTEYLHQERERMLLVKDMMMKFPEQMAAELKLTPGEKDLMKNAAKANLESLKETFEGRLDEWERILNEAIEENDNQE